MQSPPGHGSYEVYLTERGGQGSLGTLLAPSALAWARKLDDVTQATMTAPVERLSRAPQAWTDELRIDRDGETVWVGPLTKPTLHLGSVEAEGRDMTAWLDHRALLTDRLFTQVDAAFVWDRLAHDAIDQENSMNIVVVPATSGLPIDQKIVGAELEVAGDRLRRLAQGPLDYFAIARRIYVGPSGVGAPPETFLFTDAAFARVEASRDGLGFASDLQVRGAGKATGRAMLPVPAQGLVSSVVQDDTQLSPPACQRNAEQRLHVLGQQQFTITGDLSDRSPVAVDRLVPGLRCRVVLSDALPCLIAVDGVLTEMGVALSDNGQEVITVTIEPAAALSLGEVPA